MIIHLTLLPPAPQGHNPKTVKLIAACCRPLAMIVRSTMTPCCQPRGFARPCPTWMRRAGPGWSLGHPIRLIFDLWSRLVALFVNNNSLLTYIPYLALSEPLTINGNVHRCAAQC